MAHFAEAVEEGEELLAALPPLMSVARERDCQEVAILESCQLLQLLHYDAKAQALACS
jgi:hypothetical protein